MNTKPENHVVMIWSYRLSWVCLLCFYLLPIAVISLWLMNYNDPKHISYFLELPELEIINQPSLLVKLISLFILLIPVSLFMIAMLYAKNCFRAFSKGDYYSALTVNALRNFSRFIFFSVLASLFATPLLSVLLTWQNPEGLRQVAINLSSNNVFTLLVSAMFWVISSILAHGGRLQKENQSFI